MKRILFVILAVLCLAAGQSAGQGTGAAVNPDATIQKIIAWMDANPGIRTDDGDGRYLSRLVSLEPKPITLDELTDFTRVRSIQTGSNYLIAYDYFSCSFYWEGDQLCFRKTKGSQRKAGLLYQEDDLHVRFDGWWFYNGDEELNDDEHHETGIITKLSEYKAIMAIDNGDGTFEVLEFAKADGPTDLTIEDKNGYLYSFVADEYGSESLALEPGGRYDGDVVVPIFLDIDGTPYYVNTIRRGAMWKKPGATNIGTITSVTLPEYVQIVGGDAFRGNHSLKKVTYGSETRIENRAFFDCPELELDPQLPAFAYTDPGMDTGALDGFIVPMEKQEDAAEGYHWAFFKQNHNAVIFDEWKNMDSDTAMACFSNSLDDVKGATYSFRNLSLVSELFRGYLDDAGHLMIVADNDYVATHDFPAFSRWIWGEAEKDMPADFVDEMELKYGREVASCYEVGKVTSTKDQLAITEFRIKDKEACFVLSWVKDGVEVCSYMETAPAVEENSVWNVDDEGNWGIPNILTVAYDENGNVDLFLSHQAPECITYMHLRQNGSKFDLLQDRSLYVLY